MASTIIAETKPIEEGALLRGPGPLESQPWASFHRAGEIIRELRKALGNEACTGAEAPERREDPLRDEAASSRLDDDGCPNEHTTARRDATGNSGMGGRLLLVGSPIF